MITTLSAYKEMIMSHSGIVSNQQLRRNQSPDTDSAGTVAAQNEQAGQISDVKAGDAVSVELSASHDVFSAVDSFFNLGKSGRFDAFHELSPEDKEQFVKIVAELAKSGYIGYEELIVNKKVERHEIQSQIGDRRLSNARVYDEPTTKRR